MKRDDEIMKTILFEIENDMNSEKSCLKYYYEDDDPKTEEKVKNQQAEQLLKEGYITSEIDHGPPCIGSFLLLQPELTAKGRHELQKIRSVQKQ